MAENEEEEYEFPITGKFNIPLIYPVSINNNNLNIYESLERLHNYEAGTGTAANPSNGYFVHEDLEATEFIDNNPELKEIFDRLILIDFIMDNYGNISRYQDGRIINEQRRTGVKVNNLFWLQPELIIVKGSLKIAQIFKDSFENTFRREVLLGKPYIFDQWFFVWLIFNFRNNNPEIIDNFYLELMLDMIVEGEIEDLDGQYAAAKRSLDVSRSLVILLPLLAKKLPSEIKFGIMVNNLTATIEIHKTGRILIYQKSGILKTLNILDRTILGCFIIKKITELYDYWKDLPNQEKYPPPEFIDDIVHEFNDRGLTITNNVVDTKNMYAEKRNNL